MNFNIGAEIGDTPTALLRLGGNTDESQQTDQ
jgi:hypothetical protein